jgi:cellulose synthase/poly-beta-1,6-N-acetylglucosamine synthase-like glycosyltransferase
VLSDIPSASRQVFERFERRKNWRRGVSIFYLIFYISYLSWRFTIINEDALLLSVVYLIAESCGFFLCLSIVLKSWNHYHRTPKPLIAGLSVDVFIPTYQEELHIIRKTVMAASAINYQHQTFILDDGRRDEVRKIAEEFGAVYLSRAKNENAKAGNLNYGFAHSKADFVMVFDADHIPLPHALDVTLGFFADEKVALVQTPQSFYNTTAFQFMNCKKTGAIWSDQSFFYNIAQPSYDFIDTTSCVGTGVVYRRKAIDEIGGIPVETVTEDTHTSVKLSKAGYKTVYLNESVAYGIAAYDLLEYYKTRRRWGHGDLQVLKREKILSSKNLSFGQRITYISPLLNFLEGWQQILLYLIPIITLTLGFAPFEISVFNVLITLFFPFVSYLFLQEMGCGFSRLWTNEIFSMIRWPIHLATTTALFGMKLKWSPSLKNMAGKVAWKLMLPQFIIFILSVFALIFAFLNLQKHGFETGPLFQFFKQKFLALFGIFDPNYQPISIHEKLKSGYTLDLVIVAGMWVIYNICRIIFMIRKVVIDTKNSREFYPFKTAFPLSFGEEKNCGRILEISEEEIKFVEFGDSILPYKIGDFRKFTIHLPAKNLQLAIQIKNISRNIFCGKIIWDLSENRDDLIRALYSINWHYEFQQRDAYFLTPSDFLLKIFGYNPFKEKYQTWHSFLYDGKMALIANFSEKEKQASIILFEEIKCDSVINGIRISKEKIWCENLKIINQENISLLAAKGLDGALVRRYNVSLI